ncbi:MAG TPA: hypothetical protein VMU94_11390 [Streptosporangiaceae bacterium]|nr:hypothetical protein [Streptosporangiaceae bacterium]
MRHNRLANQELTLEVHCKDSVPDIVGHLLQRALRRDARVIHENVDPAELIDSVLDHRSDFSPARDIGFHGQDALPRFPDGPRYLLDHFSPRAVVVENKAFINGKLVEGPGEKAHPQAA